MIQFTQKQFSEFIEKQTQADNSFLLALEEGFVVEGVVEIKNKSTVRIENGKFERLIVANNTKVELVNVKSTNLDAGDEYEAIERITIHGGAFQEVRISAKKLVEIEKEAKIENLYFSHEFPELFNVDSRSVNQIHFADLNSTSDIKDDWPNLELGNSGYKTVNLENTRFNTIKVFASDKIKIHGSVVINALRCVAPNYDIQSSEFIDDTLDLYHPKTNRGNKIIITSLSVNILNLNNFNGTVKLYSIYKAKLVNLNTTSTTQLHNCSIDHLSYSGKWITQNEDKPSKNFDLEISNSNINTVNRIEGITFDRLLILNTKIKNGLTLHAIKVDEKFELVNLGLERSTFNNIKLSNCKEINFKYTLFKDCNFNSIQWPSGFLFHRSGETNLKPHIEAYRQIKKVYENQNNTIEAERFKRSELEVYLQDLKTQRFSDDFPWVKNEFWDYCIIWTYKIFGGYGLKLWNVIFWSIIFHTLLFLLFYSFNTEIFSFKPPWAAGKISFEQTLKAFSTYVYFANPVHSFKYEGNDIYSLWDTLIRISSAFFIFYFLKISRKFT